MTSGICILNSHQFVPTEGVGRFKGRTFSICAECGDFEHAADREEHRVAADAEMTRQMNGGQRGVSR